MPHPIDQIAELCPNIDAREWIKMGPCPDSHPEFRENLKALIFEELEQVKSGPEKAILGQRAELEGGWKIRGNTTWNSEEGLYLLNQVAAFVRDHYEVDEVHVRDRWGNVMENGNCSAPHSHSNADIAVVYTLDRGHPHEDLSTEKGTRAAMEDESGRFALIDPRISECCPTRYGFPTVDFIPFIPEGHLISFPGSLIHWVSKFKGDTPRITLAFNVGFGPAPAKLEESNLEKQVMLPRSARVIT